MNQKGIQVRPVAIKIYSPFAWVGLALLIAGCSAPDSGSKATAERGPQGTVAYKVLIDSNEPGVRIEANKEFVGNTPLELKVFGDKDGTFHNFGSPSYIIQAIPVKPGQKQHSKYFRAGEDFTGEDKIPKRVYFDMSDPDNTRVEGGPAPRW